MAIDIQKLKNYIEKMQGMYDVVRLVEPGSCHVISVPAPVLTDGNKRNSYAIELVSYRKNTVFHRISLIWKSLKQL